MTATLTTLPLSPDSELRLLVARFQAGDRDALGALYQRFHTRVRCVALRVLGHAADADDVTQWTFLKAWQKREELRDVLRVGGWLCRIASNRARALQVQGRRLCASDDVLNALAAPEVSAELRLSEHEERGRLHDAIAELPPRQRQVVSLRVEQAMSFADIAAEVGCSGVSARVNFSYAVQRLRERLVA